MNRLRLLRGAHNVYSEPRRAGNFVVLDSASIWNPRRKDPPEFGRFSQMTEGSTDDNRTGRTNDVGIGPGQAPH